MRFSLRSVSAAWAAGAVATTTLTAWIAAHAAFASAFATDAERRMARAARLGAELLQASQHLPADSVASTLASATAHRVSVFDAALALIADSDVRQGSADTLSDPRRRPEVEGALDRTAATARRRSATDGHRYVFGAARVYWQGEPATIRFGTRMDARGKRRRQARRPRRPRRFGDQLGDGSDLGPLCEEARVVARRRATLARPRRRRRTWGQALEVVADHRRRPRGCGGQPAQGRSDRPHRHRNPATRRTGATRGSSRRGSHGPRPASSHRHRQPGGAAVAGLGRSGALRRRPLGGA